MIDLGLNQNKIKEIKYEVKEGKTVIFKLNNFTLEDVEIVEENEKEDKKESNSEFENRKTREMINVAKSSFKFGELNTQKKKEINNSLKNVLDETFEKTKDIIKEDARVDSKIIKERIEDRTKEEYYNGDPNDEYSKIKSFGDVDVEKTEFVDFLKDKPYDNKNDE